MAHVYGHARPFWSMVPFKQAKDFWEWEKHPWNVAVPEDYKGVYPTKSQWEERYMNPDPGGWKTGVGPGPVGLEQVAKRIGGAGGWPGRAPWQTPSRSLTAGGASMGERAGPDLPYAEGREGMQEPLYDVSKPEEEEDEMQKLLRYMFMSELMAGMAGGDPPTPYTVQAGPAARAFPTMPSM
jgi:hypothetical protein